MTHPQLLVHHRKDNIGVVVVENLAAGTQMLCVITENDDEFSLTAVATVPLGHKVALANLAVGDTVYKYGEDIGKITAAVDKGAHVHVHNLKTKRW